MRLTGVSRFIVGVVCLGLGTGVPESSMAQADQQGHWLYILTAQENEDAKFGWVERSEASHFGGPLLRCSGEQVRLSIPLDKDLSYGLKISLRIRSDTSQVTIHGESDVSPHGVSFYATLPRRHPLYAMF